MDAVPTELTLGPPVRFSDFRWTTRWLVVGLVGLVSWRFLAFVRREWFAEIPWWPWLAVAIIGLETFLILFPVLTRYPRGRLYFPPLKRCLIEFGIAVSVVIVVEVALGLVGLLIYRLWPGTSLTPEIMRRIAESSQRSLVVAFCVLSFTVAPIAEEIFFRGFLQNAFRARMPMVVATLLQASIFGAVHTFGIAHSIMAAVLGIVLTMVYQWRKTLVTPILVHAGLNLVAATGVAIMAVAYAHSPMLGVGGDAGDGTCVVRMIMPNSAAETAGLKIGDTIVLFDGQAVHDTQHLAELVRRYKVGDTVPVLIKREGAMIEIDVVLRRRGG